VWGGWPPRNQSEEDHTLKDVMGSSRCAELLKALADAERLRLVQALRERPRNVSDLARALGSEIGNVSHHLKVLRRMGIVCNRRQGKAVIYSLSKDVFAPQSAGSDLLDLGCCRLEMPKRRST
jgi:DNA-binding transcriptional ArsR family regulator